MELKVWVEGIQRIICGVTELTTCQDVVFALAHATGKSGRFTLIERWRNNERQLAPQENPLKILMKWGEYSNDVQFILQWSESKNNPLNRSKMVTQNNTNSESPEKQKYSMFNLNKANDNVGVIKGIQIQNMPLDHHNPQQSPKKSNSIDLPDFPSQRAALSFKGPPAPPPYRDPPPPSASKKTVQDINRSEDPQPKFQKLEEPVLFNAQYRELVSLVNYQREKLSSQQVDLTKFDAEIVFFENKEREKQCQLEFIAQEIVSMSNSNRINNEQIQALTYVEEEAELVKQQEKTLKSEITLLRSKLANCETELLQCKNKIRLVMDELQMEQRALSRRNESRKQLERNLLLEMERLQSEIDVAKQSTELHHLTADTLKKEVSALENAIIEKKKEVEHLVTEMKEANLLSLSISPQDELKHIFEGPNRAGSTRRMIGSPRQLENAVPTNKNPHGVWV